MSLSSNNTNHINHATTYIPYMYEEYLQKHSATLLPNELIAKIFMERMKENDIKCLPFINKQWYVVTLSHPFVRLAHLLSQLQKAPCIYPNDQINLARLNVFSQKTLTAKDCERLKKIDPNQQGFNRLLNLAVSDNTQKFYLPLLKYFSWNPESLERSANKTIEPIIQDCLDIIRQFLSKPLDGEKIPDWLESLKKLNWHSPYLGYAIKNGKKFPLLIEKKIIDVVSLSQYQKNKELMIFVLKMHGLGLESASTDLRKDKDVVLAAVTQNGSALKYADENLKKDKEVVLTAVTQDGSALEDADKTLKKDK